MSILVPRDKVLVEVPPNYSPREFFQNEDLFFVEWVFRRSISQLRPDKNAMAFTVGVFDIGVEGGVMAQEFPRNNFFSDLKQLFTAIAQLVSKQPKCIEGALTTRHKNLFLHREHVIDVHALSRQWVISPWGRNSAYKFKPGNLVFAPQEQPLK